MSMINILACVITVFGIIYFALGIMAYNSIYNYMDKEDFNFALWPFGNRPYGELGNKISPVGRTLFWAIIFMIVLWLTN